MCYSKYDNSTFTLKGEFIVGLFRREKGRYEDIPDEKLDWNQRQMKKWQSDAPFPVDSGGAYTRKGRECIDGCLHQSLGLHNVDDLFQLKAPRFYEIYNDTCNNVFDLCEYVYKNLPNNDKYQELKGQYEELKKRCKQQDAIIEKLMAQNEKLQNELIEKVNTQSSAFSR